MQLSEQWPPCEVLQEMIDRRRVLLPNGNELEKLDEVSKLSQPLPRTVGSTSAALYNGR